MTSKRPSKLQSFAVQHADRIIDGFSIVLSITFFTFYFILINCRICTIIPSVERRNFEVVPEDGRFDVMCKVYCWSVGKYRIPVSGKIPISGKIFPDIIVPDNILVFWIGETGAKKIILTLERELKSCLTGLTSCTFICRLPYIHVLFKFQV